MDNVIAASSITIQERRSAEGLDAHVPMILRHGALYDPELDRFFRDLPLNGVRSRHSLRAYGYDVLVWTRFLSEACAKTIWQADRHDVLAYHRIRRRADAGQRISAASWNRAVACLDRLYRWGVQEGLIAIAPFTHRSVWRGGYAGQRAQVASRNDAYEPAARRADVSFVTLDDYRRFRDVGLRGLLPDGRTRPGARDRNGIRNALFSDLLVTTGLRLEEASSLFTFDLVFADQRPGRQVWLDLPDAQTKGDRGRQILVPARLLE
ncbi:site-specific integrase [Agrobacterium tomkonis]|uniref:site-specific integrase n=1 Tax=Agrobacterium tomkonis TaxID=1183410 RepID=UPI003D7F96C1